MSPAGRGAASSAVLKQTVRPSPASESKAHSLCSSWTDWPPRCQPRHGNSMIVESESSGPESPVGFAGPVDPRCLLDGQTTNFK